MNTKKISILFDHQVFSLQNYGGITAYFEGLYPKLEKYSIYGYLSLLVSSNYQISKVKKHLFLNFTDRLTRKYLKYLYFFVNSVYTLIVIKLVKFDIFHATYFEPYFLKFLGNEKLVITIYDCTYEEMGDNQNWTNRIIENRKRLIQRADVVIAISNNVKKDILKYYKIDSNKIKVIYLFSPIGNKRLFRRQDHYKYKNILYVGTRGFNKNFTRLIKAFYKLSKKYNDLTLVCLGGDNFSSEENRLINYYKLSEKVIWKGVSNDKEMIKYFRKSIMFVYPSLKEGFGIPILNSFICGCPVVASNIPVFNEIAKDAFIPFDPKSINSMSHVMDSVISGKIDTAKYINNGYRCVKKYSIKKMVGQTVKLYKMLIK